MQAIVETKPTKNELETGVYGETVLKSVFRINKKITQYTEREGNTASLKKMCKLNVFKVHFSGHTIYIEQA